MKKRLLFLVSMATLSLVGCKSNETESSISQYYRYIDKDSYAVGDLFNMQVISTPNGYIFTDKKNIEFEMISIENEVFTHSINMYKVSETGDITLEGDGANKYDIVREDKQYMFSLFENYIKIVKSYNPSLSIYSSNIYSYSYEKKQYTRLYSGTSIKEIEYSKDCICLSNNTFNAYYISLDYAQRNNIAIR